MARTRARAAPTATFSSSDPLRGETAQGEEARGHSVRNKSSHVADQRETVALLRGRVGAIAIDHNRLHHRSHINRRRWDTQKVTSTPHCTLLCASNTTPHLHLARAVRSRVIETQTSAGHSAKVRIAADPASALGLCACSLRLRERPPQKGCARRSGSSPAPSCPKQGRRPPPC